MIFGTDNNYSTVRGFDKFINRDQSFILKCIDIPFFLVIKKGRGEED